MKAGKGDVALVYALGGILFLITAWIYWDYYRPEWKGYQSGFRAQIASRFGEDRVRQIPTGLQQVWVEELNRADRCVTCHLGVEWEGMENAPHPYRTHPPEILKTHPVSRYGCTICHGGEKYATGVASAHATASPHWEEPLLYGELGKAYQINERPALLQINCNICHRADKQTDGADYINYAKQLVEEKRCALCHKINGQGGVIGPDLTYVGDQTPEHFDYSRLPGKPSVFAWHVAHFKNPKALAPESTMLNFSFGDREAQALTMLMMSWKRTKVPTAYIPRVKMANLPPAEPQKESPAPAGNK